jgi:hypothetical protein
MPLSITESGPLFPRGVISGVALFESTSCIPNARIQVIKKTDFGPALATFTIISTGWPAETTSGSDTSTVTPFFSEDVFVTARLCNVWLDEQPNKPPLKTSARQRISLAFIFSRFTPFRQACQEPFRQKAASFPVGWRIWYD